MTRCVSHSGDRRTNGGTGGCIHCNNAGDRWDGCEADSDGGSDGGQSSGMDAHLTHCCSDDSCSQCAYSGSQTADRLQPAVGLVRSVGCCVYYYWYYHRYHSWPPAREHLPTSLLSVCLSVHHTSLHMTTLCDCLHHHSLPLHCTAPLTHTISTTSAPLTLLSASSARPLRIPRSLHCVVVSCPLVHLPSVAVVVCVIMGCRPPCRLLFSLPIPVSVSVSVSVSAGSVDWQSQRQSVESKGAAVSARRHSWNDRSRTHSRWLERSEEKECSGSGRSVEADSVQPAGSVDRGEVAVVRVVTERTAIRRRRARHTIGDAVELRATLAHYKAAVDEQKDREADQARKSESEQKDEPHHSRQPVWRTRQPPELPELHLFPPSPTTQDSSEAAAAECGSDVPSAAISVLLDDSVADESVGETDSPRRSGSYRAAVPHMTLSFSSQAESLLQPEGSRRYQGDWGSDSSAPRGRAAAECSTADGRLIRRDSCHW